MMTCKEVSHLVASSEDENLGLMRRMQLRLHLLMCHHCRNYLNQIRAIGKAARYLWHRPAKDKAGLKEIEAKIMDLLPPS